MCFSLHKAVKARQNSTLKSYVCQGLHKREKPFDLGLATSSWKVSSIGGRTLLQDNKSTCFIQTTRAITVPIRPKLESPGHLMPQSRPAIQFPINLTVFPLATILGFKVYSPPYHQIGRAISNARGRFEVKEAPKEVSNTFAGFLMAAHSYQQATGQAPLRQSTLPES